MKKYIITFFLIACYYLSFALPSDTIKNELHAWKLVDGFLEEPIAFDTVVNYFQIFNPIEKQSICYSYLGNLGSPWQSNIFISEIPVGQSDFVFDRLYYPYTFTKENAIFYHAKKPFFDISWATGTKKRNENQLSALFTQNINKYWNVGIHYKLISSLGEIRRSKTFEHSMNFFTSYHGEKYSMHAAFIRNKFGNEESGGVNDTLSATPELVEPLLATAASVYYKRSFFVSQQYRFGFTEKIVIDDTTTETNFKEAGRLNHIISLDKTYRRYGEDTTDFNYYNNTYITTVGKLDSVGVNKFENILYWTFKEIKKDNFKGRLTIGATHELLKFTQIDSIYSTFKYDHYSNIKLSANLDARTKNFAFTVVGFYYPKISNTKAFKSGSYYGNVLIDKGVRIGKQETDFYININHSNSAPLLFEQNYNSIHFKWNNQFKDKINTEVKVGFNISQLGLNLELAYGIDQNYIYFDSQSLPQQYSDLLTIRSIKLQKDFKLGGFRIINKIVYQKLNNKDAVISIPEWSVYQSAYYDMQNFLEKFGIESQLGYEFYYTSWFYAPGYMPASGQFYQQRIRETGDYPTINVFLNMRIKTVLMFFKFENITNQFVMNKYYYYTNNYPINTTAFRFGVSWRFMN